MVKQLSHIFFSLSISDDDWHSSNCQQLFLTLFMWNWQRKKTTQRILPENREKRPRERKGKNWFFSLFNLAFLSSFDKFFVLYLLQWKQFLRNHHNWFLKRKSVGWSGRGLLFSGGCGMTSMLPFTPPIVKRLLGWRKGIDSDFERK